MQDRTITAIGRLALKKQDGNIAPYQFFVSNMFPDKETGYLMLLADITVTHDEGVLSAKFTGVDVERADENTFMRYLYRSGSPRGGDITFTTKAGDIEKKLTNFLHLQIRNALALAEKLNLQEDVALLKAMITLADKQLEEMKSTLGEKLRSFDKKDQQITGFSFRFLINGEEKYLNDFEVFRRQILSAGVEGKKEKYGVVSAGKHQVCSICLQKKPEVMGFASPFKFSTVDKPGMVAGFFDQRSNWKNYPICGECALEFELGKKEITENLKRYFYGLNYFLIPKPVIEGDDQELEKVIKRLKDIKYEFDSFKGDGIAKREDYIMRQLGEERINSYTLSLMFFEENMTTKAMSIKLMLEEILPSRFRRLFIDVPGLINDHPFYKQAIYYKKERSDLRFSFGIIKEFFEDQFYEMIQKVFRGEVLSREMLWSAFMKPIREQFRNGYSSIDLVLKAHLLIRYFSKLGIISYQTLPNKKNMEQPASTTTEGKTTYTKSFDREQLEEFIADNPEFFDQDYKKGVFAVGILVKLLLKIQGSQLNNSTPFDKKLKGLNINHEALSSIYMEALNKLSQYKFKGSNFHLQVYADLRNFISEYYTLQAFKLAKVSNNEISFYFVAGLEMGNKFRLEVENVEAPEETN